MINEMILHGRLVRDPEIRHTAAGIPVADVTLAWSEERGEAKKELFLSCTAWRGLAEWLGKYFRKGQEILVLGQLTTDAWTDADGQRRERTRMTITAADFCGPAQKQQASRYADDDSDLPWEDGGRP